jgi:hypothetical protein
MSLSERMRPVFHPNASGIRITAGWPATYSLFDTYASTSDDGSLAILPTLVYVGAKKGVEFTGQQDIISQTFSSPTTEFFCKSKGKHKSVAITRT